MASSPAPATRRRWLVLVGILVIAAAVGAWFFFRPHSDMTAALAANNRGIGHMEQFQYQDAVPEFEQTVRLAPDWLPAKINLGIAYLNIDSPENRRKAEGIFNEVLQKDPKNPYALYCLGMIALYENRLNDAYPRFDAVTQIDPLDAHAWLNKGVTHPDGNDSAAAKACFEKALQLNPYLNAARYAVAQHPHDRDQARTLQLLAEHKKLIDAEWQTLSGIKYTEMGHYADVIGRAVPDNVKPRPTPLPMFADAANFRVQLAKGAQWATADDLGKDATGDLRRAVRQRFGGTLVMLDYDRDGAPDLFLLGAVVESGQVQNLLLKSDGKGQYTDVTAEAGLAAPFAALGCAVGDFDNDGLPDLFLTGAGEQRLFRNTGKGGFEDVTAKAGLDSLKGVCLGAAWADIDQDGDLDLLVARYAPTVEAALGCLRGEGEGGGLEVFHNVGQAPAATTGDKRPPLAPAFKRAESPSVKGPVTSIAVSDIDADRDVDILVLVDGRPPVVILNDRLLRFHEAKGTMAPAAKWNGALVLDANHDERSDVLLVADQASPTLLIQQGGVEGDDLGERFKPGTVVSPALMQAQVTDLDMDGWADVIGLSAERKAVLLQNEAGARLVQRDAAFGPDGSLPADLLAVAAADFDGDRISDVLLWSEHDGLVVRRSLGNGNHAVRLDLSGQRAKEKPPPRSNADGIGAWVVAQAGTLWTGQENTTLCAGLGQSRLPVELGVGRAEQVDVVRLRWPDGVVQAELSVATAAPVALAESDRKPTSCPVLFTWDGERFRFVTDILGAGSLGELGADGSVRPSRPEESVKIEPGLLRPRDGHYLLRLTEPMDELLYLDRLQLVVIDHPRGVSVYPDERFVTSGPQPSQELLPFRDRFFPVKATDHKGRDVTEALRERDRKFVDSFAPRSWLGYAEDHFVELDFADRLKDIKEKDRLFLVLAGWTDYPYPESIYAASQAGVELQAPVVERLEGSTWKSVGDLGFPAGLPRVMTREVTGLLTGSTCKLRLRTNMQVYWDQIYLATLDGKDLKVTPLEVASAELSKSGFFQEVWPDGKPPVVYDGERTEPLAVSRWSGRLTRLGDVTELLRQTDDRFVLCGPGDAVTVRFDARSLPTLPDGWERSFVLKSWGYCKDASLFTAEGGKVGPLPYRAMKAYPPKTQPEEQSRYDREWNTRSAGGSPEPRR